MTQKAQRQPDGVGAARVELLKSICRNHIGNSTVTQRARILEALHTLSSVSTVECARYLDIIHPPRRVMELRDCGYQITTTWRVDHTEAGELHRVGLYILDKTEGARCV